MYRTGNLCDKPEAVVARCFLLKIALPPEQVDDADDEKKPPKNSKLPSSLPVTH